MQKQPASFGVLLVNLGTPDNPSAPAVKQFLKQFLSDPRVVDLSPWVWQPLLNGVILNTRPAKVAKLYQQIWWPDGSPLMVISQRQAAKVSDKLEQVYGQPIPVELGMSYGNPSLVDGIEKLRAQGIDKIVVLPLYPQYSSSTVAPVLDAIAAYNKTQRNVPEFRINKQYYNHPKYIEALALSVEKHWQAKGKADKLVLSFHGIPLRYVQEGDPYQSQCSDTARLLTKRLALKDSQVHVCYQSRFGREQWLTPYADELLAELPNSGTSSVDVMCPAFAADCLETLEEMSLGAKETFINAGGKRYQFIPCLNDDDPHIDMLIDLVTEQVSSWACVG